MILHQGRLPARLVGFATARDVTEEIVDVLGDVEVLVGVETERPLDVGHFIDSEGSSVYVGRAGQSRSEANCGANVDKGWLVARSSGNKGVYDG